MTQPSLLELPQDILFCIFKNLRFSDLRNVMLTCKTLRTLILEDNILWKHMGKSLFIIKESQRM